MSAIEALRAIIEEVAGVGQPYSTDSYLPAHLIHDARQAIERHEREQGGIAMKPIWALVVILVAFGVVGRVDYEVAVAEAGTTTCERLK